MYQFIDLIILIESMNQYIDLISIIRFMYQYIDIVILIESMDQYIDLLSITKFMYQSKNVLLLQSLATALQERVLSFVQQLHASETERKRLKESANSLNETSRQLQQYQDACSELENELHSSRKQVSLLAIFLLNEVCSALNSSRQIS